MSAGWALHLAGRVQAQQLPDADFEEPAIRPLGAEVDLSAAADPSEGIGIAALLVRMKSW